MSDGDNTRPADRPHDFYEAFERLLREEFGMPPEQALERINAELAANPLTADIRLELPKRDESGRPRTPPRRPGISTG